MKSLIPTGDLETHIFVLRGQNIMVDADLAQIYGVTTKRLNQQVNRNQNRFPEDFMFTLTTAEKAQVVANCNHLRNLRFSPVLPRVFTEHGALMLASVLNSPIAVEASIQVVRAFSRLRSILAAHKELVKKLAEMEGKYDAQFKVVFTAIRELMSPPAPPNRRKIGFHHSA
jgi:hypothetical protein